MNRVYTPLALKLHAFGLSRLHDPNWTGCDLYERIKDKDKNEPGEMLFKALETGLLYHLGLWMLDEYFNEFDEGFYIERELESEYRIWYLEDFIEAIIQFVPKSKGSANIKAGIALIEKIDGLYEFANEDKYYNFLVSKKGISQIVKCYKNIYKEFETYLPDFFRAYAIKYAEMVFHDRELCAFISELLVQIGYDGTYHPNETPPKQWVQRRPIPAWAIKAVRARDRGHCAECGRAVTEELEGDEHIDHIIPLKLAGTNDLVNLQLLCDECNLLKSANLIPIKSSIPPYLKKLHPKKPKVC